MAISPSPSVTLDSKPDNPEPEKPTTDLLQSTQPDPSPASAPQSASSPSPSSDNPNNSNPPSTTTTTTITPPSLPSFQSYTLPPPMTSASIPPPSAPSFRPILPQFSPVPVPNPQNPNFQNPNLQPPGVSVMLPGAASGGVGSLNVSVSPMRPLPPGASMYQVPPPGHPQPYGQAPNGYPPQAPQGSIPPPGIPRYPPQYTPMVRPVFPPRPPGPMGMLPPLSRPPVPGIRGVPPVIPPIVRPVIPIIAPTEKPQTTVYVGKIAPTVENDFILSLLRLCGPVKSWKRPQDPSNGTPRGFGFCEFESAEGVLRALRLLSKFNVDGQELMLNVNQATREYLERYVEKKTEREKLKEAEAEAEGTKKEEENAPGVEKPEPPKPLVENTKEDSDKVDKENQESSQNFGIVTDEDREADRDASDKLKSMLEERLKTKPLPPPPMLPPTDGSVKSNSEAPTKSRDDSDVDIMRNDAGDERNDDETTSENKPSSEHDRPDTSSPDRRRHDRRSRDRDRERDLKRDKERELERYEKERERERLRRERERDMKIREAERLYKERVKEWESRERDKEKQRLYEREKEKDRERQRKKEVTDQENESDDDDRRRRRRSSVLEEKRKKRKREKDDDREDRLKEEEEIAEAKRRAIEEEQQKKDEPKDVAVQMTNGNEKPIIPEEVNESSSNVAEQSYESDSFTGNHVGDVIIKNGVDDPTMSTVVSDTQQSTNAPARKLGFGLVGSGKRTTVPSVFHEEDEDEANKDKKMRPLVPIDYSNEELQAVQPPVSGAPPPNLAAAAEFAKRISNVNPKDERSEMERDRSRRSGDRSSQRERDRNDEDGHRTRDDNRDRTLDRDKDRESVSDKVKTPENKKLLDAKQLIDMIPKTKEELFSYEINWAVYDKHELHERMRPWISKKITEFLGEEEATLVDYIVSSTKEHVRASQMLELLQSILDDEAEMFVLKMWRMLIFEIKKVETGLALKPKA